MKAKQKGNSVQVKQEAVTDSVVSQKLLYYLEENADLSASLVRKAIRAQQAREAARKAREDARIWKET